MTRASISQSAHVIPVVLLLFLDACLVEARRSRGGSRSATKGSAQHSRDADPLPWWAITLVFVGGVMGLFLCVMALRKIYEKKRQQKIRMMMSRRSVNIQRRLSQQENANSGASPNGDRRGHVAPIAPPQIRADAPPTYEQSQQHDVSLPPAYFKEVDTSDEQPAQATPSLQRDSAFVSSAIDTHIAPPSYDAATNNDSEVVEVGGAASMEIDPIENNPAHNSPAVLQV